MHEEKCILIVGTNQRNLELLSGFLNKQGYKSIGAINIPQINKIITEGNRIDLVLLDITGFDNSIWDICQKLHDKNIQLLIISPRQSASITKESIAHSANGVLVKPLVMNELLGLIKKLLES